MYLSKLLSHKITKHGEMVVDKSWEPGWASWLAQKFSTTLLNVRSGLDKHKSYLFKSFSAQEFLTTLLNKEQFHEVYKAAFSYYVAGGRESTNMWHFVWHFLPIFIMNYWKVLKKLGFSSSWQNLWSLHLKYNVGDWGCAKLIFLYERYSEWHREGGVLISQEKALRNMGTLQNFEKKC